MLRYYTALLATCLGAYCFSLPTGFWQASSTGSAVAPQQFQVVWMPGLMPFTNGNHLDTNLSKLGTLVSAGFTSTTPQYPTLYNANGAPIAFLGSTFMVMSNFAKIKSSWAATGFSPSPYIVPPSNSVCFALTNTLKADSQIPIGNGAGSQGATNKIVLVWVASYGSDSDGNGRVQDVVQLDAPIGASNSTINVSYMRDALTGRGPRLEVSGSTTIDSARIAGTFTNIPYEFVLRIVTNISLSVYDPTNNYNLVGETHLSFINLGTNGGVPFVMTRIYWGEDNVEGVTFANSYDCMSFFAVDTNATFVGP